MIDVTEATRKSYMTDGTHKEIIIQFPELNLTIENDSIKQGSFSVDETVLTGSSLEFVGCIASKMEVTIENKYTQILKGSKVEAYIRANNTELLKIFTGYIDSSKKEANRRLRKLEAYDILYKLSEKDVTDWYNNGPQMTITDLLGSLCDYIGLSYYVPSPLINGGVTCFRGQYKKVSNLSALDLLKQICQFNACFGRINREGKFEVRYMALNRTLYPGPNVYPAVDLYPAKPISEGDENFFNFYESVEYEDFHVKPIDIVVIRNSSNEEGYKYGEGTNKYIIQNNIFAYNQNGAILVKCAERIKNRIKDVTFIPYTSKNNGLPFIECGDEVVYHDLTKLSTDKNIHFIVFSRTLSGDQVLRDRYQATGDEYQTEFITDLSASLSDIDNRLDNMQKDIDNLYDALRDTEKTDFKIVSTYEIPSAPEDGTLYVLQGQYISVVVK